jgi:hypothetical protein
LSIQPSTYSPDIAVPSDRRVFGARDLFSLWFSLGIGLMVLQTGALLAPGLGCPARCWRFSRHAGRCAAAGRGWRDRQRHRPVAMAALKLSLGAKARACRRCSTCCN